LAFDAIREQKAVPVDVGMESDIFSLGLVLVHSLGGRLADRAKPTPVLCWSKGSEIPLGLSDILHRCLATDPARRYRRAEDLASDLRRHLANLPLVGVRNRSVIERWRKWRRRHPQGNVVAVLTLLVVLGLGALGYLGWKQQSQQGEQMRLHWENGRHFVVHKNYPDALESFEKAQAAARQSLTGRSLRRQLDEDIQRVRQLAAEQDLELFVDRIRYLQADRIDNPAVLEELRNRCRQAWDQFTFLLQRITEPSRKSHVRDLLVELVLVWADLEAAEETDARTTTARRRTIIDEAEMVLGAHRLFAEADSEASAADANLSSTLSAWEEFQLARQHYATGDLHKALPRFQSVTHREPSDFWGWFYLGLCQQRLGKAADAIHSLTVAIALRPTSAECFLHRGNARGSIGQFAQAKQDYDRALDLETNMAPALLNRGILQLKEHHWPEARRDLESALTAGAQPARVHFHLALAMEGEGKLDDAREHARLAAELSPEWEDAGILQRRLEQRR
jgi:tetratricopeptide (TPR) repeat protein